MDAAAAGPDYPFKPVAPTTAADLLGEAEHHLEVAVGEQAWEEVSTSAEAHLHMALVLAVMAAAEELAEVRRAIERHP